MDVTVAAGERLHHLALLRKERHDFEVEAAAARREMEADKVALAASPQLCRKSQRIADGLVRDPRLQTASKERRLAELKKKVEADEHPPLRIDSVSRALAQASEGRKQGPAHERLFKAAAEREAAKIDEAVSKEGEQPAGSSKLTAEQQREVVDRLYCVPPRYSEEVLLVTSPMVGGAESLSSGRVADQQLFDRLYTTPLQSTCVAFDEMCDPAREGNTFSPSLGTVTNLLAALRKEKANPCSRHWPAKEPDEAERTPKRKVQENGAYWQRSSEWEGRRRAKIEKKAAEKAAKTRKEEEELLRQRRKMAAVDANEVDFTRLHLGRKKAPNAVEPLVVWEDLYIPQPGALELQEASTSA